MVATVGEQVEVGNLVGWGVGVGSWERIEYGESNRGRCVYKLAVLEIMRNLFVLAYIACPRYPYIWSLPTL